MASPSSCVFLLVLLVHLNVQHVSSQTFNDYVGKTYTITYTKTNDPYLVSDARYWATCDTPGCAPTVTLRRNRDQYLLTGTYPWMPQDMWFTIEKSFCWTNIPEWKLSTFKIKEGQLWECRTWNKPGGEGTLQSITTYTFGQRLEIRTEQGSKFFYTSLSQLG